MANALPILLLGAGALLVLGKKKKKAAGRCPVEIALDVTNAQIVAEVDSALKMSEDPIRVADIAFARLVPNGCTKKDYKTKVTGNVARDISSDLNLSMFYASLVTLVLERTLDMDNPDDLARGNGIIERISTWYSQLVGEPLPDID